MASAEVDRPVRNIGARREAVIDEMANTLIGTLFGPVSKEMGGRPVGFSLMLLYPRKRGGFEHVATHRFDDEQHEFHDGLAEAFARAFAKMGLEFAGGIFPKDPKRLS